MPEQTVPESHPRQPRGWLAKLGLAGVLAAAFLALAFTGRRDEEASASSSTEETPSASPMKNAASVPMSPASYRDGTYSVVGTYVSPAGPEEVGVTLTLVDGKIVDAIFEAKATAPVSKKFQAAFAGGYREQVIGRDLADLKLDKVSGSSLTPKGFNAALEAVRDQAKS